MVRETDVEAQSSPAPDEMLMASEVAKILKVSESWLAKARGRGDGPPFIRIGRSVRYLPLAKWLEAEVQ